MLLVHYFLVLKYITLFVELHWCWVFEADTEIWEFTKHTSRDALIWADVLKKCLDSDKNMFKKKFVISQFFKM